MKVFRSTISALWYGLSSVLSRSEAISGPSLFGRLGHRLLQARYLHRVGFQRRQGGSILAQGIESMDIGQGRCQFGDVRPLGVTAGDQQQCRRDPQPGQPAASHSISFRDDGNLRGSQPRR